ncbi:MAG: hypothetical protein EB015_22610 [Methylocystaceae bacterium]|nr:hypothetical protein [Methylocystaceae bacterium]
MGLFDSFPITEHDLLASGRHLNLIGQVNMLHQHNYELQTKLELANSRISELEAALKPFAEMTATIVDGMVAHSFTMDDIRAARKVLGENQ